MERFWKLIHKCLILLISLDKKNVCINLKKKSFHKKKKKQTWRETWKQIKKKSSHLPSTSCSHLQDRFHIVSSSFVHGTRLLWLLWFSWLALFSDAVQRTILSPRKLWRTSHDICKNNQEKLQQFLWQRKMEIKKMLFSTLWEVKRKCSFGALYELLERAAR